MFCFKCICALNECIALCFNFRDIAEICTRLSKLLLSCANIRIGRTLMNCLLNLCPKPNNLQKTLRNLLMRTDVSSNVRVALEYAIDKIEGFVRTYQR